MQFQQLWFSNNLTRSHLGRQALGHFLWNPSRLNSADHFASVEYFRQLLRHTHPPCTNGLPSLVRNFMVALNSFHFCLYIYRFSSKKIRAKMSWMNGCYHSTNKNLHIIKMKSWKIPSPMKYPLITEIELCRFSSK